MKHLREASKLPFYCWHLQYNYTTCKGIADEPQSGKTVSQMMHLCYSNEFYPDLLPDIYTIYLSWLNIIKCKIPIYLTKIALMQISNRSWTHKYLYLQVTNLTTKELHHKSLQPLQHPKLDHIMNRCNTSSIMLWLFYSPLIYHLSKC